MSELFLGVNEAILYGAWLAKRYKEETGNDPDYITEEDRRDFTDWKVRRFREGADLYAEWKTAQHPQTEAPCVTES